MTDTAIAELLACVGVRHACQAVGAAQAELLPAPPHQRATGCGRCRSRTCDRHSAWAHQARPNATRSSTILHSDRFVDMAPAEVWATLLDDGRLPRLDLDVRPAATPGRRNPGTAPPSHPPGHHETGTGCLPAESVWSWDITKLRGPASRTYYHLYVILDIYSRYVVGWMVATRESAALAEVLIRQTCAKQGIAADQLTIHADRGSSMTSKPVAFLLADLGVTQSHSPPDLIRRQPIQRLCRGRGYAEHEPGSWVRAGRAGMAGVNCAA